MQVKAPDGGWFIVRRRWLPWRRRDLRLPDTPDLTTGGGSGDDGVAATVGLVLAGLALLPVVVAAALIVGQLLLMLLLLPFWLLARGLFGAPWHLEVKDPRGVVVHEERVVGWSGSRHRMRELAASIESGTFARVAG